MSTNKTMTGLALSFPTLRGVPGAEPWCAEKLDTWAVEGAASIGALHAARFVLAVWNNGPRWRCGRFDLIDAVHTWDRQHLDALRNWLVHPRLP